MGDVCLLLGFSCASDSGKHSARAKPCFSGRNRSQIVKVQRVATSSRTILGAHKVVALPTPDVLSSVQVARHHASAPAGGILAVLQGACATGQLGLADAWYPRLLLRISSWPSCASAREPREPASAMIAFQCPASTSTPRLMLAQTVRSRAAVRCMAYLRQEQVIQPEASHSTSAADHSICSPASTG